MASTSNAKKKMSLQKKHNLIGWAFLIPASLLIFVFCFYPMFQAILLSFKKGMGAAQTWAGIANYSRILKDRTFKQCLFNTVFYFIIQVPVMLILALMLLLGAALGYYAAEMLLQKSLRVFRSRMRGLFIVWAVLLLGVAVVEFDLTGYERRVPETEEIQSVALINDGTVTADAESIELTRKIHQTAIDNEEHNRQTDAAGFIHIRYELKDGSSLSRSYEVDNSRDWVDNSGRSEYALCRELYLLPQNKELLMEAQNKIKAENIIFCDVERLLPVSDEFSASYEQLRLSPQQAEELYTQCILPDTRDSMLGTQWFYMDETAYESRSDTSLYMHLESFDGSDDGLYVFSVNITLDAERTLVWLEENLDIEVKPYLEVRPEALEGTMYY